MRQIWLLFAQTVTIALGVYVVIATLRPNLIAPQSSAARAVAVQQAAAPTAGSGPGVGTYRDAARRAMPSVVNILTSQTPRRANHPLFNDPALRRFFGERDPERTQSSLGSGVIVSPDGTILTNNHVVEAADQIEVVLSDGRRAPARIVGTDPDTDIAVIRVDLGTLPAIVFGRDDQARVGDVVLAIGNPFGVGQTVTMGIISALGRNNLRINPFENFIQTDAAINSGNSGGALIDTNGNLLGINSAIYSQSGGSVGIGFAIPAATAKTVMDAIIRTGQVVRGWIGVESQDITPELAENFGLEQHLGVIIAGVVRNGPAERAGIRPGDILTAVEGRRVADTASMLNLIAQLTPGNNARLTLLRKNGPRTVEITVGKRPRTR